MTPKKAVAGDKLPANKGNCVLCAVVAERACQRCGDFYCSKDCQLQDWQRHRYICFPLPALVYPKSFSMHQSESTDKLSLEDVCFLDKPKTAVVENGSSRIIPIMEYDGTTSKVGPESSSAAGAGAVPKNVPVTSAQIPRTTNSIVSINNTPNLRKKNISPPKAIVPPSNSLVIISGFRSPNRCHIRDASKTADEAFGRMCEKVNAMGNEMPRMVTARTHGYCLASYNGKFRRASVITTTGKQTARVLLFDLGIAKSQKLSDMREVNDELLSLPSFSVQVQLKDVPNYVITDDIMEFLSRFEGGKFVVVYTKSPGAINVELLDAQTKESLNSRICEFCMNLKLFESPYVGNKNHNEKEPPMQQKKPNPSVPAKIGIEMEIAAGIERSIPILDEVCAKIEKNMVNETKDPTKTDPHPQNDDKTTGQHKKKLDCAHVLGESTKNIKQTPITIEIENLNQSLEPKADESLLHKDKDIHGPKDESVREFQTQCLALKPTLPDSDTKYEHVPASVTPKKKLDVETPVSKSEPEENGNVGPMLIPPFEMRRFRNLNKEGINLFVVDVSKIARGIFGAFDCQFSSEFSTLHSRLSEISDSEPYKPVLKEFVLARFKGSWYRGRVERIKNTPEQTEYRVMYLDYTNSADITDKDIRRYPSDFTTPCTTNICMIDGFPHKPSPAQVDYLSDTVKVHQLIHVDSVIYLSIQSDIAIVKSRSLIDKLISL